MAAAVADDGGSEVDFASIRLLELRHRTKNLLGIGATVTVKTRFRFFMTGTQLS